MSSPSGNRADERLVRIPAGPEMLEGSLGIPDHAQGVVLFAHGSGSSRHSPRNRYVASVILDAGLATLLFDLLTEEEDRVYETRFDIDLLTRRLLLATEWVKQQAAMRSLAI